MQSAFSEEVAAGSTVMPVLGSVARTAARPPKLGANDPFMLIYDPTRYTVMDGHVVPAFKQLALTPGVNGVDVVKDRRTGLPTGVSIGMATAMAQDRGHIPIQFDWIPEPLQRLCRGGVVSYIWRPEGTDAHLSIFTRCFAGSKKIVADVPAYVAWIDWLVSSDKIPAPPTHVLEDLRAQRIEERDKMADRAQTVPSLKGLVKQLSAEVDAITLLLVARGEAVVDDEDDDGPPGLVEAGGAGVAPVVDDAPPKAPRAKKAT